MGGFLTLEHGEQEENVVELKLFYLRILTHAYYAWPLGRMKLVIRNRVFLTASDTVNSPEISLESSFPCSLLTGVAIFLLPALLLLVLKVG